VSREDAERRLGTLARQRGDELVLFACHAALPVVLNPDLVHLLRINYFLDPPVVLSYTAEAQLLLSPLCSEIDDGLYVMDPELRDLLLHRLVEEYGGGRLRDVARLLWEYGQRGTPWLERPGLSEAQQLTALNFIDSPRALAWLERAEGGEGASPMEQRWFVAMRQDLSGRATAVKDAEAQAVYLPDRLPALAELRDVLASLYPDLSAARRAAGKVGVFVSGLSREPRAADRWQRVLEAAWLLNRVPTVLEFAVQDHPNYPSLTRAILEYWMRVTPVLTVDAGRFEAAPPEWQVLEQHRAAIERTLGMVTLIRVVEGEKFTWLGLGALLGDGAILAHRTVAEGLGREDGGRWTLRKGIKAFADFADRHRQWPGEGANRRRVPASRFQVTHLEVDKETGLALLRVAPEHVPDMPRPLRAATRPPADLIGRKVFLFGYPMQDSRNDPAVLERMLGGVYSALRLHVGQIVSVGDSPLQITHNCFTSGGTGGAPLVDLESGEVLGIHFASRYAPGPQGLKAGTALALWPLADRPWLTGAGVFAAPGGQPAAETPAPDAEPRGQRVFLSYSRTVDSAVAERVAGALRTAGIQRWPHDPGAEVASTAPNQLSRFVETADCVVVLLSKAALASSYVLGEVRTAENALVPLIPVLLEQDRIPPSLNHVVYLDLLRGDMEKNLAGLVNTVRRLTAAEERHTYEVSVHSYFNPPDAIRQLGRKLGGPSFAHLVARLDDNQAVIGLYRNQAGALVATHLHSRARMMEMEDRFSPSEGYYAVDIERVNEGLDHKIVRPADWATRPPSGGAPTGLILGERLRDPDPAPPPVPPRAPAPDPRDTLIDRQAEQDAFARMLEEGRDEARLMLIEGDPGMGKTALLRRMLQMASSRSVPCWLINLMRDPSALELLQQIREAWLLRGERDRRVVLLLDDADSAPAEVKGWLRAALLPMAASPDVRLVVVLAGRDLAEFETEPPHRIVRQRLGALDQRSIRDWLAQAGVSSSAAEELIQLLEHTGVSQTHQLAQMIAALSPPGAKGSPPPPANEDE
jgi:hypothetical protein